MSERRDYEATIERLVGERDEARAEVVRLRDALTNLANALTDADRDSLSRPAINALRALGEVVDTPQLHSSSCDEGPNHPGPCHPRRGLRAADPETP